MSEMSDDEVEDVQGALAGDAEMFSITVNVAGRDFVLTLDHATAQEVLNDQQLAEKYVYTLFPQYAPGNSSSSSCSNFNKERKKKVWFSKSRPTSEDTEATTLLLEERMKNRHLFDGKVKSNNFLWNEIARKLDNAGFDICPGKDGPGAKCKQKFANMEVKYKAHVKHMNQTGVEKKDPPPFFDMLHSILGGKDKFNPRNLQDTETQKKSSEIQLSDEDESGATGVETEKADKTEEIKNRFSGVKKKLKKSQGEALLEEMKRQFEIETKMFNDVCEVQNRQREDMLSIMKKYFKRKRRPEDESSDSD